MSASVTTTDHRVPLQALPGGLAGWLQRNLANPAAAPQQPTASEGGASEQGERVFATAWPVRRDADLTMYRCRMWDGMRVSDPFFVRAPHGFLAADPVLVLAKLATANEDAFNILRRAELRGFAVEFNQEPTATAVVSSALARIALDTQAREMVPAEVVQ